MLVLRREIKPCFVCVCPCTTEEDLLCRSVWSERSGTLASDKAVTRCRQGEELFSCSSYSQGRTRAGDKIEVRERTEHREGKTERGMDKESQRKVRTTQREKASCKTEKVE